MRTTRLTLSPEVQETCEEARAAVQQTNRLWHDAWGWCSVEQSDGSHGTHWLRSFVSLSSVYAKTEVSRLLKIFLPYDDWSLPPSRAQLEGDNASPLAHKLKPCRYSYDLPHHRGGALHTSSPNSVVRLVCIFPTIYSKVVLIMCLFSYHAVPELLTRLAYLSLLLLLSKLLYISLLRIHCDGLTIYISMHC